MIAVLEKPQLKSSATRQTPKAATAIEQGLLEQIAAKPQDDGLRLVYADFLTEQGSRWGEVIIAQVAVPTDDADDYGDKLEVSMKLEKKHAKAWLEPIRPFLTRWSFERGLLSVVATEPDKFLQAADAIALRAPRATLASLQNLKELRVMAQGPVTATDLDRLVNARPLLTSLQVIHQTKDIVPEAVKERLRARRE